MTAAATTDTRTVGKAGPGRLTGTGRLLRLALRRDRVVLPVWLLVLASIPAITVGEYARLYPDPTQRAALTRSLGGNPSITLLYGPAHDLSTAGGFTAWRFGTLLPVFLALVCVFTLTRHTRQEEETGRQELLASTVVGRAAPLTAALLLSAGLGLLTGLVTAGALTVSGTAVPGSLAFGLGLTSVAWVFTGVAAVTAQLAEYARTANGLAGGALGVMFALRGIGDSADGFTWVSWLSPIGWSTRIQPFTGNRWWVLLVPAVVAVALVVTAFVLRPRRDLGLGLLPASLGPATAPPRLRTPFALASRLHRGMLLGWVVGFAVFGALFGALASDVGDIVGDSAEMRATLARMGGSEGVVDAFLATMANFAGMVAALFAVQAALRMRAEESAVRLEPLLATGVSRVRWITGHLVFVLGGSAALVGTAGAVMGAVHGSRTGDVGGGFGDVFVGCLAQIPAVWVVAGTAVALFGLVPRAAPGAWGVAAVFVLISLFGPVLNLGQAVLNLSPFDHVPRLPGAAFTATPLVWLTVVAAALLTAGVWGLRRRDVG